MTESLLIVGSCIIFYAGFSAGVRHMKEEQKRVEHSREAWAEITAYAVKQGWIEREPEKQD